MTVNILNPYIRACKDTDSTFNTGQLGFEIWAATKIRSLYRTSEPRNDCLSIRKVIQKNKTTW